MGNSWFIGDTKYLTRRKAYHMDAKEQEDIDNMDKRNRFWNGFYESLLYALLGIALGLCAKMFIEGFFGFH